MATVGHLFDIKRLIIGNVLGGVFVRQELIYRDGKYHRIKSFPYLVFQDDIWKVFGPGRFDVNFTIDGAAYRSDSSNIRWKILDLHGFGRGENQSVLFTEILIIAGEFQQVDE